MDSSNDYSPFFSLLSSFPAFSFLCLLCLIFYSSLTQGCLRTDHTGVTNLVVRMGLALRRRLVSCSSRRTAAPRPTHGRSVQRGDRACWRRTVPEHSTASWRTRPPASRTAECWVSACCCRGVCSSLHETPTLLHIIHRVSEKPGQMVVSELICKILSPPFQGNPVYVTLSPF